MEGITPEVLLVLDPASSTGYCLCKITANTASIYEYGFIDVDLKSEYQGDHCIDLMVKLDALIDLHRVTHIAIEDYFFSKRFAKGSNVNAAFRTAIHILARAKGIPYTILNITSWKIYVAGRSTPTKEQKKRWGADPAKKLYIQQALWERHHFKFPNHSISPKTNKPIQFRFDIVDACGQAVFFCGMIRRIPPENITLEVEPPKDIEFKKPSKKIFVYPTGNEPVKIEFAKEKNPRKRRTKSIKQIRETTIQKKAVRVQKSKGQKCQTKSLSKSSRGSKVYQENL